MICCYCDRTLSCGGCGMEQPDNAPDECHSGTAMDRQRRAQLEGLAIGLDQRGDKSAAHLIRLTVADLDSLRKALYELLYVSFPPVGADTPDLVKKHHDAIRIGCELLGINPNGLL